MDSKKEHDEMIACWLAWIAEHDEEITFSQFEAYVRGCDGAVYPYWMGWMLHAEFDRKALKEMPPEIKEWGHGLPYARLSAADMYMEDASTIALEAMDAIEKGLAKFGIEVPDEKQDEVFMPILKFVEERCNGNYRHEH